MDGCTLTYENDPDNGLLFTFYTPPVPTVVSASVTLSGIQCASCACARACARAAPFSRAHVMSRPVGLARASLADTAAEEAVLQAAIAATLDGVETDDIGDTTCTDSRRRLSGASDASRRRLDDGGGATIDFEITVTADTLSIAIAGSDDDAGFVDASSVIATALDFGRELRRARGQHCDRGRRERQHRDDVRRRRVRQRDGGESYEAVSGIGCDDYTTWTRGQYGDVWLDGSEDSLEACAAAVKSFASCDDAEYFFYEWEAPATADDGRMLLRRR